MGELEMKAREFAPLVVFDRKPELKSLDSIAGESLAKDALKEIAESLDKVVSGEPLVKPEQDDFRTVFEQDIDPAVYDSAEYGVSVSYGATTEQVAYTYKGLSHDGKEANSASYDVNWSTVEETKLHGRLQDAHEAAKDASQMGRVEISSLDPVQKNAKQEMALRNGPTFSFLQYALLGKIDFL